MMITNVKTDEALALNDLGPLLHVFDNSTSLDIDLSLTSIIAATTYINDTEASGEGPGSTIRANDDCKTTELSSTKSFYANSVPNNDAGISDSSYVKIVTVADNENCSDESENGNNDSDSVGNATQTQSSVQKEDLLMIIKEVGKYLPSQTRKKEKWKLQLDQLLEIKEDLTKTNVDVKMLGVKFLKAMKSFGIALKSCMRPFYIQEDIEIYAVQIVNVGEEMTAVGLKGFARTFTLMLKSLISYWIKNSGYDIRLSRGWRHTRCVISLMLRHLSSADVLIATEKALLSLQLRIVQHCNKDKMNEIVSAVREVHELQDVVMHQLISVGNFAI
uniref:DUF4806 domain-containing protein n=1 Tax=Syphacia muris TaxID=451379 RepID=A0A158R5A1_9BILA